MRGPRFKIEKGRYILIGLSKLTRVNMRYQWSVGVRDYMTVDETK